MATASEIAALVIISARMKGRLGPAKALEALRKAGFVVRVTRWRNYEEGDYGVTDGRVRRRFWGAERDARAAGWDQSKAQPCGGITYVVIEHPDYDISVRAEAVCREDENFDRRLGLRVALGRALRELVDVRVPDDTGQPIRLVGLA